MNSKSSKVLAGKAVLAIVEFEVEDEEVAFVEAIVVDSSSDTMKEHRGEPEKTERERENFWYWKNIETDEWILDYNGVCYLQYIYHQESIEKYLSIYLPD